MLAIVIGASSFSVRRSALPAALPILLFWACSKPLSHVAEPAAARPLTMKSSGRTNSSYGAPRFAPGDISLSSALKNTIG